jgi:hypothetical protein
MYQYSNILLGKMLLLHTMRPLLEKMSLKHTLYMYMPPLENMCPRDIVFLYSPPDICIPPDSVFVSQILNNNLSRLMYNSTPLNSQSMFLLDMGYKLVDPQGRTYQEGILFCSYHHNCILRGRFLERQNYLSQCYRWLYIGKKKLRV